MGSYVLLSTRREHEIRLIQLIMTYESYLPKQVDVLTSKNHPLHNKVNYRKSTVIVII